MNSMTDTFVKIAWSLEFVIRFIPCKKGARVGLG